MDGRQLRLWLCGGVVLGALGCHKQQTLPNGVAVPPPGQPMAMAQPKKPSLFEKLTPSKPTVTSNAPPVDMAAEPKPPRKKGEWSADTTVALAELRVENAYTNDKTEADRDKLLDSARNLYQSALKTDPKHKGAMLGLGKLYARLGEMNKADEMYRQYLALNPKDHATMHEVAMAHAKRKDFAGAAAWCEQALKADPENRGYRKTLGFCLTHAGKWDDGFAVLCDVMSEAEARYTMARALTSLNQPEMGKQQLAIALQVDPNFTPAKDLLAEMQQPTATPRTVEPTSPIQAVEHRQP